MNCIDEIYANKYYNEGISIYCMHFPTKFYIKKIPSL